MSDWIILQVEPTFVSVTEGEIVPRLDQARYTLQEVGTGQVKKLTCGLTDKWADTFLERSPGNRASAA
ncbi:MAG: hypothetical protein ACR2OZ_02225 [Verrucomicrobiales bacterium]